MNKLFQSTFTAIALGLLFSIPYAAPTNAAAKFDDTLNPMAIAKLPVCNSNSSGSRASINDFSGTATWNGSLGTGGGTGTASVYCDGGSWKFAAGGAATQIVSTAPILTAPTTSLGNYGTGCSSGNQSINGNPNYKCLLLDDHWNGTITLNTSTVASSATALNTTYWRSGHYQNQSYIYGTEGSGYCGGNPGPFPFTTWGLGNTGNQYWSEDFNFPYGSATDPTAGNYTIAGQNDTNTPYLAKYADGSLLFNVLQNNWAATHSVNGGPGGNTCTPTTPPVGTWGSATITSSEGTVAEIPHTGGLIQWTYKFDSGVLKGVYPGMECDADFISNGNNGTATNANFEFGYTFQPDGTLNTATGPLTNLSFGLDNTAVHSVNFPGGPGVGASGIASSHAVYAVPTNNDLTMNFHTFALEYTGDNGGSLGTWNYYVDGTLVNSVPAAAAAGNSAVANNGGAVASLGANYQCGLTVNMPNEGGGISSFHSIWDNVTNGPFHMWSSDVQFYKKPGT